MASPRADLGKLEKAYTADPEPECWCGKPLIHIDSYGDTSEKWQHATTDPMYAHAISLWRNAGDPDVLDAVQEVRYLRQLAQDLRQQMSIAHRIMGESLYDATTGAALSYLGPFFRTEDDE